MSPLATYLRRTFCRLFAVISGGLTVLYSVIELLEKLVYAPTVPLRITLEYLALNALPTWLTLLSITLWLALVATLFHAASRREWHTCWVLGITPIQLIRPLVNLISSIIILVFIGQHTGLDALTSASTQFYQQVYKHQSPHQIRNITHIAPNGTVCMTRSFTPGSGTGTDITLHYYHNALLQKTVTAPTYTVTGDMVYLPNATHIVASCPPEACSGLTIHLPSLTALLHTTHQTQSALDIALCWWHTTPHDTTLLRVLWDTVSPLYEAFFLALITLLIFMLLSTHIVAIMSIYPCLLVLRIGIVASTGGSILAHASLFLGTALAIIAFAKHKNSRILTNTV